MIRSDGCRMSGTRTAHGLLQCASDGRLFCWVRLCFEFERHVVHHAHGHRISSAPDKEMNT